MRRGGGRHRHLQLGSKGGKKVMERKKKKMKKKAKKQKQFLTFDEDDGDEEEFEPPPKKKVKTNKNPRIDTSYLPDAERDAEDEKLRQVYREKWHEEQKKIKQEELTLSYCYYDGSNHRRTTRVKKGETINDFLESARKLLAPHFSDLRGLHGSSLMFIK